MKKRSMGVPIQVQETVHTDKTYVKKPLHMKGLPHLDL